MLAGRAAQGTKTSRLRGPLIEFQRLQVISLINAIKHGIPSAWLGYKCVELMVTICILTIEIRALEYCTI